MPHQACQYYEEVLEYLMYVPAKLKENLPDMGVSLYHSDKLRRSTHPSHQQLRPGTTSSAIVCGHGDFVWLPHMRVVRLIGALSTRARCRWSKSNAPQE